MAAFAKHKIYVFFLSDAPEISPDVERKKKVHLFLPCDDVVNFCCLCYVLHRKSTLKKLISFQIQNVFLCHWLLFLKE